MEVKKKVIMLFMCICVASTINAQFLGTDGIYYKYTNNYSSKNNKGKK